MDNHSDKYENVLTYYSRKLWNISRVKNAVIKGWITPEEFQEITGEPYEEV